MLSQILATSLFTAILGDMKYPDGVVLRNYLAPVQIVQSQAQVVPVVLPPFVEVTLKPNDQKKLGKLTNLNPQQRSLTITRGEQSETIPINKIKQVIGLEDDNGVPGSPLRPPRGEKRNWQNIPLGSLKIQDPHQGGAKISLPTGVDPKISSDRNALYVIAELSFSMVNQMNMTIFVLK
jgi:hypothetical protein